MAGTNHPMNHPTYHLTTLGCPKNRVDSDKLEGLLAAGGYAPAPSLAQADLVVVNTCAFIEAAREESIETILRLSSLRKAGARLAVTGCLAERHGAELAAAMPEIDVVAGFGVPFIDAGEGAGAASGVGAASSRFDLLRLPRPSAAAPWAYVKVAEGCDRRCAFCAIPTFRGAQRSREPAEILDEIEQLGAVEVVLVAQDLASYGRDIGRPGAIVDLVGAAAARVERVRLLYLYPSSLNAALVEAIVATGVPYFDLSLQHASGALLRRMRRWGSARRFTDLIARIRTCAPEAALRSSFIVGHPGETESDHDRLLAFVEDVRLDWAGFFAFSPEEGTPSAAMDGAVPPGLVAERIAEVSELQEGITADRRASLVGATVEALIDAPGEGRTYREAPEIDGVVQLAGRGAAGTGALVEAVVTGAAGPDLEAKVVRVVRPGPRAGMGRGGPVRGRAVRGHPVRLGPTVRRRATPALAGTSR